MICRLPVALLLLTVSGLFGIACQQPSAPASAPATMARSTPPQQAPQPASQPNTSGEAPIPKIYGMTYDDARALLIKEGWMPDKRGWQYGSDPAVAYGNGPIFWARGYFELESSSGTGMAYCIFHCRDASGRRLVVVTEGEEGEKPTDGYHATVEKCYLEGQNK